MAGKISLKGIGGSLPNPIHKPGRSRCRTQGIFSDKREMDGIAIEQISEALKITAGNCGVLLYRVRMQLRRCLEAKGLED